MVESTLPVGGSGELLETRELTNTAGDQVHREVMSQGDPDDFAAITKVTNGAPGQTDYGAVIRPIPKLPLVCTSYINTYLLNAGSEDMGVDGSDPAVEFSYTADGDSSIGRLMLFMESAGNMDSIKFGDLAALANGVTIVCDGTTIGTWKDNIDTQTTMFDYVNAGKAFGKEGKVLTGRWTFYKADDDLRGMALDDGAVFKAVVNDDLSGLAVFRIRIQGAVL